MNKSQRRYINHLKKIAEQKLYDFPDNSVTKTKLTHEPETFYCLTVPNGTFVIEYNGKTSVTGNCHSLAGSAAFRIAMTEMIDEEIITQDDKKKLYRKIVRSAKEITEHEYRIIDMIFEKGEIEGITKDEMKIFVQSRVNLCLNNLGIEGIYDINDNPIGKWFYGSINMPTIHDFFVNLGSEYNRDWAEKAFIVPDTYTFKG